MLSFSLHSQKKWYGLPEAEIIGQGLTFKLDKYEIDGVVYIDTPGLCDDSRRKVNFLGNWQNYIRVVMHGY